MSQKVRIVFRGEIIAGEAEEGVKRRAAQLFKASSEQIERIFSGAPIVLRKDLPEEEGVRYREYLEKAGMRVYVEKMKAKTAVPPPSPPPSRASPVGTPFPTIIDTPASGPEPGFTPAPQPHQPMAAPEKSSVYRTKASLLFSSPDNDQPAAPVAPQELTLVDAPPPEEIACPKCGAKQSRRTLCLECGVDIPRFLKMQEEEKALLQTPGGPLAVVQGSGEHVEAKGFRILDDEDGTPSSGKKSGSAGSPYRAPAARLEASFEGNSETAGLMDYLSLAPSGHMKRMTYLTASFFQISVACVMTGALWRQMASFMNSISPGASTVENYMLPNPMWMWIVALVSTVYSVRISIHRCRDIGWSPWLVSLLFLPIVNIVFALCLLFWPSDGEEAPQGSVKILLVSIGALVLCGIWAGAGATKMTAAAVQQAQQMQEMQKTPSNR